MIKIGIDPGKQTGVAIVFGGKLESLMTTDFWGCYDFVRTYYPDHTEIHIEDTSDLPVFHGYNNNAKAKSAIGRDVGSVCREASLLVEGFESLGYKVVRHTNKKSSKLDAKTFNRLTGWSGKSNQHTRDAAVLVI